MLEEAYQTIDVGRTLINPTAGRKDRALLSPAAKEKLHQQYRDKGWVVRQRGGGTGKPFQGTIDGETGNVKVVVPLDGGVSETFHEVFHGHDLAKLKEFYDLHGLSLTNEKVDKFLADPQRRYQFERAAHIRVLKFRKVLGLTDQDVADLIKSLMHYYRRAHGQYREPKSGEAVTLKRNQVWINEQWEK